MEDNPYRLQSLTTKLSSAYAVTDASVHDSQELDALIDKIDAGQKLYGNRAYIGPYKSIVLCAMTNEIHEKGGRNHLLTDVQRGANQKNSTVRARVEHIFGYSTNNMKALYVRAIGISQEQKLKSA
ncbi:MAG: transposase [Chlorobiaceae bacterium]